jgi:hypothetical protein
MGFVTPDPSNLTYDPYLGAIRMSDSGGSGSPYITSGSSGISSIRMQTSGGYVYDFTCDDTGDWVSTLVSAPGSTTGQSIGLLLALTYS